MVGVECHCHGEVRTAEGAWMCQLVILGAFDIYMNDQRM